MLTLALCSSLALPAPPTPVLMKWLKFFGIGRDAGAAPVPAARSSLDEGVENKRRRNGMAMQTLRSQLKSGKLTQEEYDERVRKLSAIS